MSKRLLVAGILLLFCQLGFSQRYFGGTTGFDNYNFNRIASSAMVNGNQVDAFLEKFSRTPTIGGDYMWLPGRLIVQLDAAYNSTSLANLGKKDFTYESLSDSGAIEGVDQLVHFKGGLGYNFSKKHILSFLVNGEALWGDFVYFNDIYSAIDNFNINNINLEEIEESMTYGLSFKFNLGLKVSDLFAVTLTPGYSFVWNNNEDTSSRGFDIILGLFRGL